MKATGNERSKGSADEHERRLLRRVADKDRMAFEQLFYAYYPRVQRFVVRIVKRPLLAEELVNDVMLIVWNKAGSFAGLSRVSTWVFGISYRVALKALRKRKLRQIFVQNEIALEQASDDGGYGIRMDQDWLRRGFDQLSPSQRAVVELSYFAGYGYAEIATILNCPENTVKTRMYHARRKLKSILPPLAEIAEQPETQTS